MKPIPSSISGRARAQLSSIRQMRSKGLEQDGDRVTRRNLFGGIEVWVRVPGTGSGESSWFELKSGED